MRLAALLLLSLPLFGQVEVVVSPEPMAVIRAVCQLPLAKACGAINDALTLADRTWTCVCGVSHDRDLNAALNIRSEGLKMLAAGHVESLNARGPGVRLPQLGAVGVEA